MEIINARTSFETQYLLDLRSSTLETRSCFFAYDRATDTVTLRHGAGEVTPAYCEGLGDVYPFNEYAPIVILDTSETPE